MVRRSTLGGLIAVVTISVATIILFYPVWLQGRIYIEPDTVNYYYPALRAWQEWLRRGELLLWTPNTLAGFPLFAEGEVGMLYPVNDLLLVLFPFDVAFVLIPPIHVAIAALGAFSFARWHTRNVAAGLIAALGYGLGGLMLAQIHHTDVHSGFAWMPWMFWTLERARCTAGRARAHWAASLVAVTSMQFLTVHPQVPLITLFGLSIYVGIDSVLAPGPVRDRFAQTVTSGVTIGLGAIAAIGLAAVQLAPLVEVGLHSQRTSGWDYARATEYAQSPWNLIAGVFPLFYVDRFGLDWGHWIRWEAPMYVGVVTLGLALAGLVLSRHRARFALGVMAALALWISFADYSPVNVHWALFQVPVFGVLRAPGRFVVLYDFAAATLAALGVAALAEMIDARRRRVMLYLIGWSAFAVAVTSGLVVLWLVLSASHERAIDLLRSTFLAVRRADPTISADRILTNLLDVLRPWGNARTGFGVALLIASAAVLWAWWCWPRLRIWQVALVGLLAADLVGLGVRFHNSAPLAELPAQSETARYVIDHRGLHRVLSVNDPNTRGLRLLPFETAVVGGDSSLETGPYAQFAVSVDRDDGGLLDLWNVRYVVQRKGAYGPTDVNFPGPAWYERTLIDPDRPLAQMVAGAANSSVELRPPSHFEVSEILVASHLRFASDVSQDTPVGLIVLQTRDGDTESLPLRAGVETAEWAAARPDVTPQLQHRIATVAYRYPNDAENRVIYFARVPLAGPKELESIRIERVEDAPPLYVFGLAALASDGPTWQFGRYDKARYRRVMEDREAVVFENTAVMPRAFLVSHLEKATDSFGALAKMRELGFDAHSTAIVESDPPVLGGDQSTDNDSVVFEDYRARAVSIVTKSDGDRLLVVTDSMFPGWNATVDGVPARVFEVDALFRGVRVPAGEHRVEFRFHPWSFRIGLAITVLTALAMLCWLVWALRSAMEDAAREDAAVQTRTPSNSRRAIWR